MIETSKAVIAMAALRVRASAILYSDARNSEGRIRLRSPNPRRIVADADYFRACCALADVDPLVPVLGDFPGPSFFAFVMMSRMNSLPFASFESRMSSAVARPVLGNYVLSGRIEHINIAGFTDLDAHDPFLERGRFVLRAPPTKIMPMTFPFSSLMGS